MISLAPSSGTHHPILKHIAVISAGVALFLFASAAVSVHVKVMAAARDVSLPLASQVSLLERKKLILEQEIEAAEVQVRIREGSPYERMQAYVFPADSDVSRFLTALDIHAEHLKDRGELVFISPVEVSTPRASSHDDAHVMERTIRFQATLKPAALASLHQLFAVSGLVTVSDALPASRVQELLSLLDTAPMGVTAVEQILRTDLLAYGRAPDIHGGKLTAAFASQDSLVTVQSVLASPILRDAASLFALIGEDLSAHKLWPLPLVTPVALDVQKGEGEMLNASFELRTYGRADK